MGNKRDGSEGKVELPKAGGEGRREKLKGMTYGTMLSDQN